MSHRSPAWLIALLVLAAATPAGGELERLAPDGAHAELARAGGVVLVDVYAEF